MYEICNWHTRSFLILPKVSSDVHSASNDTFFSSRKTHSAVRVLDVVVLQDWAFPTAEKSGALPQPPARHHVPRAAAVLPHVLRWLSTGHHHHTTAHRHAPRHLARGRWAYAAPQPGRYSMVLTKFFVLGVDLLWKYSCSQE